MKARRLGVSHSDRVFAAEGEQFAQWNRSCWPPSRRPKRGYQKAASPSARSSFKRRERVCGINRPARWNGQTLSRQLPVRYDSRQCDCSISSRAHHAAFLHICPGRGILFDAPLPPDIVCRSSSPATHSLCVNKGTGFSRLWRLADVAASAAAAGPHPDCLSERSPVTIHNRAGHRKVPGPVSFGARKTSRSIHPRLRHDSPHPAATHPFRPRIHTCPICRHTSTRSPLPQALDLVPRRASSLHAMPCRGSCVRGQNHHLATGVIPGGKGPVACS
jgi:hypothetical protein